MIDLDKLMKLHDKATTGAWAHGVDTAFMDKNIHEITADDDSRYIASFVEPDVAEYICTACNSIPDLVHRIRELEDEVESLRDALEESENRRNEPFTDEEFDWIKKNA